MQLKTRTWVLISLTCFVLAAWFWRLGEERANRRPRASLVPARPAPEPLPLGPVNYHSSPALLSAQTAQPQDTASPAQPNLPDPALRANPLLTNRLANTRQRLAELLRNDNALLLRNALIDTTGQPLQIPKGLRAEGDPGTYLVQARGTITDAFRKQVTAAGGSVVAYIPNNAYLVRIDQAGAENLRGSPQTQAVLGWEPYYKLDLPLLAMALNNEALPPGERLSVLVFDDARDEAATALQALGASILAESRAPFGRQFIVQPRRDAPADHLAALARLSAVQAIEPHRDRQLANDLTRLDTSVVTNTLAANNYLGLIGSNVMVNVTDTGVEATHPDLTGRVFGEATTDNNGHGTHVAGIIGSTGLNSPAASKVPGSTNGASFRGIAPGVTFFTLPIDLLTGPLISDAYLQERAASTNVFISNNSWGYVGSSEYNMSSASFDAAVRDALPEITGPQQLLYVFAAGNSGGGGVDGAGGVPDTIVSPATAKNVITVGAFEHFRFDDTSTNTAAFSNVVIRANANSSDQVAGFSSRGNVGVGMEGEGGRFKPDLVAPGTFVVSCRATNWTDPDTQVSGTVYRITDEFIEGRGTNLYSMVLPYNATGMVIRILRNSRTPAILPGLNIHLKKDTPPVFDANDFLGVNIGSRPVTPGLWWYGIQNTNTRPVHFDIQLIIIGTNNFGGTYYVDLKRMNDAVAPFYRYESGTSQAAAAVSGVLALMQEMFQERLKWTNSPALMKALLINGARSLACSQCPERYSLQVNSPINYQGWGAVNLTNAIPPALASGAAASNAWPYVMFDQDPNRSLGTGDSHTYDVNLNTVAQSHPLRVTLVWTDPPGNPAASLKLVNDLDLIITNKATGEFYLGNNIPAGSDVTDPIIPAVSTNNLPYDAVNNVENVIINPSLDRNYSVTVRARRVNVNAVTTQTNGILQDYALVISSGNSRITNMFSSPPAQTYITGYDASQNVRSISNRQALLDERVGASSPFISPTPNSGASNQWNFYVFENTVPTNINVAILTFLPPNLARSRFKEADIDLYVSTDSSITNLNPAAIATAWKSTRRGGSEFVIRTNTPVPATYYIGVKAEDQQAASFGIYVLATGADFGGDENGRIPLTFDTMVGGWEIPDGAPESPGWMSLIAIVANDATVRRVVIEEYSIVHENGGDLLGNLSHLDKFTVLNNHRGFNGLATFILDDSGEADIDNSIGTDGPGSLRDFENEPAFGPWILTVSDNALFHTGQVVRLSGYIEPNNDTNGLLPNVRLTIDPGDWRYLTIDVPVGVTNVITSLTEMTGDLDVYIRRDRRPTIIAYDKFAPITPPGGAMHYGIADDPPLQPGRYSIGVSNPTTATITFRIRVDFEYGLNIAETATYMSQDTPLPIRDDAITSSIITATNSRALADVRVGVRIDHPRLADLVLHLVSPLGTRLLLNENRGGLYTVDPFGQTSGGVTNFGFGLPAVYAIPVSSSGTAPETRTNISTTSRSGVIRIDYDFENIPDRLTIFYEGRRIFDSGDRSGTGSFNVLYGPGISTNFIVVMNEGNNPNVGTVWRYTVTVTGPWNYATFTDKPTLGDPIKFSFPPYYTFPTNRLILSNDFENVQFVPPGTNQMNFAQNDVFEYWRVITNGVAVLTDTNWPAFGTNIASYAGSNYLALSDGTISLPLTNFYPDRDYIISFAHRKVSSSPTEHSGVIVPPNADVFHDLMPRSVVGNQPVPVPKLRACPGQEISITISNCPLFDCDAEGDPTTPYRGLPDRSLVGCWSSHPTILDSNTVVSAPFLIGTNKLFYAPPEPGSYYLFLGINDLAYNDANRLVLDGVGVEWEHCQMATAQYGLGTAFIEFTPIGSWKTETFLFTANPSVTNLSFRAGLNTVVEIDGLRIDEAVSTQYYLSEEPLAPLAGEPVTGDWKLEVWDNRSGPFTGSNTNATLLSWSLNFTFADYSLAVPLTNGVAHSNFVAGDRIRYFVVAVPPNVTNAYNFLAGGDVELLYSPDGLPKGEMPPDPIPPVFPDLELTPNFPQGAEIPTGRFYYLGVRNLNPNAGTNWFRITATFRDHRDGPMLPIVRPLPVNAPLPLGPVFMVTNILPVATTRAQPQLAIGSMDYYYFDVPTNARSARVNLLSAVGDLNLVLRRALPVLDLFPHPTHFDYESTEVKPMNQDSILVITNSTPAALAPGRWYAGVYNIGTNNPSIPTRYFIDAEISATNLFTIVDLAESTPVPFSVPVNNLPTNFYRFGATNAAAMMLQIYDLTNDVDLIVKRGDLPSLDLYDFSYRLKGSPAEPIPLRTNIFLPALTLDTSTNWYAAVVLRSPGIPGAGKICVATYPENAPPVGCDFVANVSIQIIGGVPQVVLQFDTVAGTMYAIEYTTDLIIWQPAPVPFQPFPGTGGSMSVNFDVPTTSGTVFYRLVAL